MTESRWWDYCLWQLARSSSAKRAAQWHRKAKANVCCWYTTAKTTYADHSGLNNQQGWYDDLGKGWHPGMISGKIEGSFSSCFLQVAVWKKTAKAAWWGKYFLCARAVLIVNINSKCYLSSLSLSLFSLLFIKPTLFFSMDTHTHCWGTDNLHYLQDAVSLATYRNAVLNDWLTVSRTAAHR